LGNEKKVDAAFSEFFPPVHLSASPLMKGLLTSFQWKSRWQPGKPRAARALAQGIIGNPGHRCGIRDRGAFL
jgi:hypothetical protein